MKNIFFIPLLLLLAHTFSWAQSIFRGTVDYGQYQYEYILHPTKQRGRYDFKINILMENQPPKLIYQSFATINGSLGQGSQYKVQFFYAEKINEQWKTDPTSYAEIGFDLTNNKMTHDNRGIIAKKEAQELIEVLNIDLARESITEAQAVDYAVQYLVVNYNQLFGNYAISEPQRQTVVQLGKKNTAIFVSPEEAPNNFRDTLSYRGKNYAFQLTEMKKYHYSLVISLVTKGEDIISEETAYSSEIRVEDKSGNKDHYGVKILYAQGKGYTWKTSPQSFVQMNFNFTKKTIQVRVEGKLAELSTGKIAKEYKLPSKEYYTKQDMLGDAVRFFVRNFPKALAK